MNTDETLKLAKEAGWHGMLLPVALPQIMRFAELVAAAEREACAKACEALRANWAWENYTPEDHARDECAAAIRAKGRRGGPEN